jgi:hypothetical protein
VRDCEGESPRINYREEIGNDWGMVGRLACPLRVFRDSVIPQSRPSPTSDRTQTRAITQGMLDAPLAGGTGENSPHYTNQPTKTKTDRVPVNIFLP